MAKVTDIQDKNGVSKEIQDKDLANRTSQNSIASSDFVLLEDTNGAYHKIAKASFTEAVRGALGSVINSVAKGTDIAKVPVLDSNNDLGMGTLANLASVLGGQLFPKKEPGLLTSDDDLDNIVSPGAYQVANADAPANCPSWGGFNAYILVLSWATDYRYIQIFIEGNTNKVGFRIGNVWSGWNSWLTISAT